MKKSGDVISQENDFEETIGALFVPEGMWGGTSAFVISWVYVLGVGNIGIGLWESRDFGGDLIPVWEDESSNLIWNRVVKLWEWDEVLLPEESETNLHDHSKELVDEFFLVFHSERDVGNSLFELWEVLVDNESGIFFWNEKVSELINRPLDEEPWHNQ